MGADHFEEDDVPREPVLQSTKKRPGRPKGSKAKTQRAKHLGIHHFRFLSSLLQGIELRWAYDRYLGFTGETNDIRHIRAKASSLLAEIQTLSADRFRAEEHLRPCIEALQGFRFEWERQNKSQRSSLLPPVSITRPTIEEWSLEQQIPEDMYSEDELIDMYEEAMATQFEAAAQTAPQQKAIQLATEPAYARSATTYSRALDQLEAHLATSPKPEDNIGDWLHPTLTRPLRRAGILSIRDLIKFIDVYGFRWYRRVDGVGLSRSVPLTQWVSGVAHSMGTPLRETSLRKWMDIALEREQRLHAIDDSTKIFGIVPLERLAVPDQLNGRQGLFRAAGANTLGVHTDLDALLAWLSFYEAKPKTYKTHRWAVETFALWSILVARKPMSSLDQQDLLAYAKFISSPPPDWTALPSPSLRSTSHWRPFTKGKLKTGSIRQALVSIKAMFAAWMNAGYVTANPVAGVTKSFSIARIEVNTERSFSVEQWVFVNRYLSSQPNTPATRRMRLILALGELGLRLSEIATRRHGDFYTDTFSQDLVKVPMLRVVGKGNKERLLPVGEHIQALARAHHLDRAKIYRSESDVQGPYSLIADPNPAPILPLIFPIKPPPPRKHLAPDATEPTMVPSLYDPERTIDPTGMYQAIKRFFQGAAKVADGHIDRTVFEQASTHWMRHFFGRLAAANGVEPTAIMSAMGHADLKTTTIYTRPKTAHVVRELGKIKGTFDEGIGTPPSPKDC